MNQVERFRAIMNFQSVDRLPRWEWARWWDKTIERWHGEGLPRNFHFSNVFDISRYFKLDPYMQFWFSTTDPTIEAAQHHTDGSVAGMDDYLKLRPSLFPSHDESIRSMTPWAQKQTQGEVVVWATLEGFFWFPRTLMDIEKLSYAYYDQPEIIHRINSDLLEFNLSLVEKIAKVCIPTFFTFAEDMSYNHGPMISKEVFDEFISPYYSKLLNRIAELNAVAIVDTDGDVTELVPWLQSVGVHGVLPLERQANVDGLKLRKQFPELRMIGHFNKLTMSCGEQAMRDEFERLVPLIKSGGFIPSVDHQTPPEVSLEQYLSYLRLLNEYTKC